MDRKYVLVSYLHAQGLAKIGIKEGLWRWRLA